MPQGASRTAQAASEGRGACVCTSGADDALGGLWESRRALLSQWQSKTWPSWWQCQPSKLPRPTALVSGCLGSLLGGMSLAWRAGLTGQGLRMMRGRLCQRQPVGRTDRSAFGAGCRGTSPP